MHASRPAQTRSTLPRPWERAPGFHDLLYEWMEHAPWMAISAALHLLLFFVLMAIPWEQFRPRAPVVIEADISLPRRELFPEAVEKPREPEIAPANIEPELQTAEPAESDDALDPDFDEYTPHELSLPLDSVGLDGILGVGAGGPRYTGRGTKRGGGGRATEAALLHGLAWLQAHQSPDGSWDADGFPELCGRIGPGRCEGRGAAAHDVGLTGLALLAFLGDGSTMSDGPHALVVRRGVRWLKEQQDVESGRIGRLASRDFVYDHAIATLAICEAFYFSRSPQLRPVAQRAVDHVAAIRNRYGAWRYDDPPVGDNDTSVTGWMVFALKSAQDAGLVVDDEAFDGALAWFDEVTDPATGRAGYDGPGTLSSRTAANRHFPVEQGEAMTAVALLCRIFLGRTPEEDPLLLRHAELLRRKPPVWDPEGFGCDMYYWYYGTYATYQLGGREWAVWSRAMEPAIVDSQRRDGDQKGSWDPVGPWGHVGGRVYSTALMTLCLEVYYRYGRVLGGR